jgi:hypothetical protein
LFTVVQFLVAGRAVAVSAVYRLFSAGLEGNFGVFAAGCAHRGIHLALLAITAAEISAPSVLGFAGRAALGATTGVIGKSLFSKEFLLRCRKHKFHSTVTACQGTILKHKKPPQICYPLALGFDVVTLTNGIEEGIIQNLILWTLVIIARR